MCRGGCESCPLRMGGQKAAVHPRRAGQTHCTPRPGGTLGRADHSSHVAGVAGSQLIFPGGGFTIVEGTSSAERKRETMLGLQVSPKDSLIGRSRLRLNHRTSDNPILIHEMLREARSSGFAGALPSEPVSYCPTPDPGNPAECQGRTSPRRPVEARRETPAGS